MRFAAASTAAGARAILHVAGSAGAWIDVADAARETLGLADWPALPTAVLGRDGPGLRVCRQILAGVAAGEVPASVRRYEQPDLIFAPPVSDPGSFLDFYAFEEHVRGARARRGLEVPPEWHRLPAYYRSNHRSFVGSGREVWFPAGETKPDFELEVAAVIAAPLYRPSPAEAAAAIAGFCLLNDWSARSLQRELMAIGLGPGKAKEFATSLGPWLVTPDEVPDWAAVEMAVRVNGVEWTRSSPGAMRWSWGEMLAFAAEDARFEPGDVFGSGTLGRGCGLELDRFLRPGDSVELDGGDLFGVLASEVRQREG
jgi:fumarylacetoacetate (FAA) hydrolase